MKNIPPYSLLILILFTSCLTRNKTASQDKQIESLLSQMTLEEKIGMLHGNTMFSSGGVPRLGIPDLQYSDGPHGVQIGRGTVRMGNQQNGPMMPVHIYRHSLLYQLHGTVNWHIYTEKYSELNAKLVESTSV